MFDYDTTRFVHLDFHTPDFVRVGEKFDAREFGETLEKAEVNSIAVFALCHHGNVYYDTKIGVRHPGLACDLLGGMTGELKKRGIQSIIYFSQNVNETFSSAHPECAALKADGSPVNSQILLSGDELYWTWLCPNRGAWIDDFFLPLVREAVSKNHADGIFIDMSGYLPGSCFCESCRAKMKAEGLDINDPDQHSDFLVRTNQQVAGKLRRLLDEVRPGMRLMIGAFNRMGDALKGRGVVSEFYLETLPAQTGWFMFPFLSRYFRNTGIPAFGMTGRFLNNWGDFGTVKTAHQLKIELATHLAAGLPNGVGDHMHFNGRLDPAVYDVIGEAFKFAKERQPYCAGGDFAREVIIPAPKRMSAVAATMTRKNGPAFNQMTAVTGLTKMMTELHFQWDVSNDDTDFAKYGAVVLNHGTCEEDDVEKIGRFVEDGGLLVACHEGLNAKTPAATAALRKILGVRSAELLEDPGVYYLATDENLAKDMPREMPVYTHTRSYKVKFDDDVEALASLILAPCVRSREKFYGHFHGAPDRAAGIAVGHRRHGRGHVVAMGPSLFYSYMKTGHAHHLTLVRNIMEKYYPDGRRMLRTNAPGIVELAMSKKDGRIVVQAVPFVASRRDSESFETLNDVVPVHGVEVSARTPFKKPVVRDPLGNSVLSHAEKDGFVRFTLPPFAEHSLTVVEESCGE